jgi:thioredoxin 1
MASEKIPHVTDDTFEADVLKSDVPTLVDFTAQWCGPCKMLAPILEKAVDRYEGKVKFVKMDVDDNQKTAQGYRIFSIPTLLLFADGQVKGQSVGLINESKLDELIAKGS